MVQTTEQIINSTTNTPDIVVALALVLKREPEDILTSMGKVLEIILLLQMERVTKENFPKQDRRIRNIARADLMIFKGKD